jgi:hypothetical protein
VLARINPWEYKDLWIQMISQYVYLIFFNSYYI